MAMTAVERGDGLPADAFDRPCPAMSPADRWHLDVYGVRPALVVAAQPACLMSVVAL